MELRLLDHVPDELYIHELPVIFTGSIDKCNAHALSLGYKWRRNFNYLFGGYFAHLETKHCLFIT